MRINICFISDNNYVEHLVVSMTSILKNANIDDDLYFYILENDISINNKNKILSLTNIKSCEISFFKISVRMFENFPNYNLNYINKTGYYRYLVADILKDIDKVLYLDNDIVVLSSLKNLFAENIEDYYLGGIEDICYYFYNKFHNTNYEQYINSGVLLINLNLWRKEKVSSKLLDVTKKDGYKFPFGDQEAINIVCGRKIKLLDLSWNIQRTFFEINNLLYHPLKKQIIKAFKNIKIIHYTSIKKPWNSYTPLRRYYVKYSRISPFGYSVSFKLKLKILVDFILYMILSFCLILKFLLSPIIKIYRENGSIRVKLLCLFEFKLFK